MVWTPDYLIFTSINPSGVALLSHCYLCPGPTLHSYSFESKPKTCQGQKESHPVNGAGRTRTDMCRAQMNVLRCPAAVEDTTLGLFSGHPLLPIWARRLIHELDGIVFS